MLYYQEIHAMIANEVHLPISFYSVEKPNHPIQLKMSKVISFLVKFLIMIIGFQGFWGQSELMCFWGKNATIEH